MQEMLRLDDGAVLAKLDAGDVALLLGVAPGLFDNPVRPAEARAFLDDPANLMIVVMVADQIVSFVSGSVLRHPDKAPSMFINEVGTRDAYLRRGYAKAACQAAFAEARATGCEGIWLGTEADNVAARALYRSLEGKEVHGVYYGWDDAL